MRKQTLKVEESKPNGFKPRDLCDFQDKNPHCFKNGKVIFKPFFVKIRQDSQFFMPYTNVAKKLNDKTRAME